MFKSRIVQIPPFPSINWLLWFIYLQVLAKLNFWLVIFGYVFFFNFNTYRISFRSFKINFRILFTFSNLVYLPFIVILNCILWELILVTTLILGILLDKLVQFWSCELTYVCKFLRIAALILMIEYGPDSFLSFRHPRAFGLSQYNPIPFLLSPGKNCEHMYLYTEPSP